jgi:uncharacterized membrane protein
MMKSRNLALYAAILVAATIFIVLGYNLVKPESIIENGEYYRAKVISIESVESEEIMIDEEGNEISNKQILFTAEILSGSRRNEVVNAEQYIDVLYPAPKRQIEEGDRVIMHLRTLEEGGEAENMWSFYEYNRSDYLILLCTIFFILIVAVGRKKGVTTLISLIYTALAIFAVYIPSILRGYNIYLSTTIISIFIIVVSLLLLNGVNKKTLCAVLGNIGGAATAAILGLLTNRIMNITGIVDQDSVYLTYLASGVSIDLRAIVWGSIVIGSLGAIMDVSMSLSSSMNELGVSMHNKSFAKLLRAGMNIGKDMIGTMTNTLILAYIGGSLATVLILVAYNNDLLLLFNMEMIVVEVIQAIVGSIGILFAVPATALFAARIYTDETEK